MIDATTLEQARQTDLIAFLETRRGFTFAHRDNTYRCQQHPSLAIKYDRLSWYWHRRGYGGYGLLDYLIKVEDMPFREAVAAVLAYVRPLAGGQPLTHCHPSTIHPRCETEAAKTLILPEKAKTPVRIYDYLYRIRGIDLEIIQQLIREKKIYEDLNGNVVFVGYDEQNNPRGATLRGTCGDRQGTYGGYGYGGCRFHMDAPGSDKRYGFHMDACTITEQPTDNKGLQLYIFESAIDAMSHATMEDIITSDKTAWRRDNRLSLGGVTDKALDKYLENHQQVNELILCLDNDAAGREAAAEMASKYADKGYRVRLSLPGNKDYNDDLLELRKKANGRPWDTSSCADRIGYGDLDSHYACWGTQKQTKNKRTDEFNFITHDHRTATNR